LGPGGKSLAFRFLPNVDYVRIIGTDINVSLFVICSRTNANNSRGRSSSNQISNIDNNIRRFLVRAPKKLLRKETELSSPTLCRSLGGQRKLMLAMSNLALQS
jgi:hypothetical protein